MFHRIQWDTVGVAPAPGQARFAISPSPLALSADAIGEQPGSLPLPSMLYLSWKHHVGLKAHRRMLHEPGRRMESVVHGSLQGPVAELSLHAMHAIDTYVRRTRRVIWKAPCSGLLHYPHLMCPPVCTQSTGSVLTCTLYPCL